MATNEEGVIRMRKVYCYNCKWVWKAFNCTNTELVAWNRDMVMYGFRMNLDHKCKHYKRKWWKFWVR